jgi:hypothetical protein
MIVTFIGAEHVDVAAIQGDRVHMHEHVVRAELG